MKRSHGAVWLVAATLGMFALAGCQSRPAREDDAPRAGRTPAADPGLPARMPARAAHEFLAKHPEALLLDVRNAPEWNDDVGHIEGAVLIPLSELGGRLAEIEGWKNKPVVVVSRVGDRGGAAVLVLREAGFTRVTGIDGGMVAWREAGL